MPSQTFLMEHGEVPYYTTEELPEQDFTSALAKADKQAKLIKSI